MLLCYSLHYVAKKPHRFSFRLKSSVLTRESAYRRPRAYSRHNFPIRCRLPSKWTEDGQRGRAAAEPLPPVFQQALQEQNTARPTPRGSNDRRPRWPLLDQNTPQRDNNGPHGAAGSASNGHSVNVFLLYFTGLLRLLLGLWTKLELCFKIKACHCVSLPKQWLFCFRSLLFTPLNRTSTLCGGKCSTKAFFGWTELLFKSPSAVWAQPSVSS